MSKTSQELKAKKAKKLAVEDQVVDQKAPETETVTIKETPVEETTEKIIKAARVRGKKYLAAKKKIDVSKLYSPKEAVKLIKETSFSKFDGKIQAHLTVIDIGNLGEINFPHLELGTKRIELLNDKILAELKEGKINFDILIATTTTMPKLLPYARILGPKGLMPNPKNGTLTDKPEEAMKKLAVAKTVIKTESKAPVLHITIGKVSQPEKEIEANLAELIKVVKAPKIKKIVLSATMSPGVKVLVEK
ncbi:MAG: hypothetical protein PHR98_00570 [Candidatus Shapirobacteria bacterium]|jgi:large subunit ribosomal protein L1|nr:hypothetical protein [Candidatus Shapirobacteria bacterium]